MKKIQIIALAAAILVFLCIFLFLKLQDGTASTNNGGKNAVAVAAQDIVPSTAITEDMIEMKKIPAEEVQENGFTDPSQLIGRVATAKIYAGDQVLKDNTGTAEYALQGLAVSLPKGKRAVTLAFESEPQGRLGDLLRVGNRVDVVSAQDVKINGEETKKCASMLLQNQEIVALDNRLVNSAEVESETTYETVTLAITPEDVLKLISAQENGSIRLILRPQSDEEIKEIDAALIY